MNLTNVFLWIWIFLLLLFLVRTAEQGTTSISLLPSTNKTLSSLSPAVNLMSSSTTLNQTNSTGSLSDDILKTNESYQNLTSSDSIGIRRIFKENNGAVLRAFYVVVGVTAIVIVYFVVRSVRLRRKRSKTRKYGITGKNLDLEMTPLDQDDEEDDLTVFEAPKHNKR
ncbi:hypothetical protein CHUAL_011027 [Chamberlinius hualienensis]